MNISSICRRRIVTIDSKGALTQAARLMREHHVGSLVVTTDGQDGPQVVGVVTDRDLVISVLANGLDTSSLAVGALASPQIVSVTEDDGVDAALALMRDSGVRRLLVVDEKRQLTGIVALDDLVEACVDLVSGLGQVIRRGIEREAAHVAPLPVPPVLRIPATGTAGWTR
jgi:CBS domain-containing protein